jgi:hypothetical protein
MQKIISFFIIALLAAALGAGCGQRAVEKTIERGIENETGNQVDVDVDRNAVNITDEETGASLSAGDEVTFPDDFPSDIPKYENGTLKMVTENMGVNQYGYMMQTRDDAVVVAAWFKDEAQKAGWQLQSSMTIQQSSIMMFERTGGESGMSLNVSVSVDEDDAGTVNIVVNRSGG